MKKKKKSIHDISGSCHFCSSYRKNMYYAKGVCLTDFTSKWLFIYFFILVQINFTGNLLGTLPNLNQPTIYLKFN